MKEAEIPLPEVVTQPDRRSESVSLADSVDIRRIAESTRLSAFVEETENDDAALTTIARDTASRAVVESAADSTQAAEGNSRQDAIVLVDSSSVVWLRGQPASYYTVQLATANDDIYLAEFAGSIANRRGRQLIVLPLPTVNASDTRPYTLLFGSFNSFDNAQNALARLPDRARQFGARVRNFGVLQESLR